ncbi:MAG: hypothetical protein ACOVN3_01540 [Limnohabitans sp.]
MAAACLLINGAMLLALSGLMASGSEGLLVFLTLPWNSFLTDLSGMATLQSIDAGSVWIAWFLWTCISTLFWWMATPLTHKSSPQELDGASLVKNRKIEIESAPALKERLNKLNQLLQK